MLPPFYGDDTVFESVAGKMFEATNSFFTPRSLLMVEEHKGFFRSCLEHELLRMTEDSFEKVRTCCPKHQNIRFAHHVIGRDIPLCLETCILISNIVFSSFK